MNLDNKKIILGIVGEIAAGKGEFTEYVENKFNGFAYRSSEVLRDIIKRMYLEETRPNLQKVSTMIRKFFGENIISFVTLGDLKKIKNNLIAIDGLRRLADFEYLKKDFDLKIIFIESDLKNRFQRISKRIENKDDEGKNFKEFKKDHQWETEKYIKDLKEKADFVIKNDGSLKSFHARIEEVVNKIIN